MDKAKGGGFRWRCTTPVLLIISHPGGCALPGAHKKREDSNTAFPFYHASVLNAVSAGRSHIFPNQIAVPGSDNNVRNHIHLIHFQIRVYRQAYHLISHPGGYRQVIRSS